MRRVYTGLTFYILCALLVAIGCVSIYSASYVYAFERGLSPEYYLNKQIFGLVIAIIIGTCIAITPSHIIRTCAPYAFIAALALTLATLLPGIGMTMHGAHRWIRIGALTMQPSEILKICTIWYLSYFLDKKTFTMRDFYHTFLPALIIIIMAISIFLLQPDFGQAVTLGVTCFLLLYIFEIPNRYLYSVAIGGTVVLTLLILHAPYRLQRIMSFIDPWNDPQGRGFQIIQSLIAIGSGGLTGQGITCSQQKYFYLPMHHTDFIFAIIAEETGFIGATILILLFALLLYTGYTLAMHATSRMGQSFILGYTLLIIIQAWANMSVALGMLPTKGLGLPFISYGSSALVAHGIACGIMKHHWNHDKLRKDMV